MAMITATDPDLRRQFHPHCVVCAPACGHGLQLQLSLDADGAAIGEFYCDARFEGYAGLLHGGVIASLLDGAMTNCLFLHGQVAVTAELRLRFRHPVQVGEMAQLRAWIERPEPPIFRLRADLRQGGILKATAEGAFMVPRKLLRTGV